MQMNLIINVALIFLVLYEFNANLRVLVAYLKMRILRQEARRKVRRWF